MSEFTDADILKLAKLSRLKLTAAEIAKYKLELSAIVSYIERLQLVDVAGLEPTSQVTGLVDVFRPDDEVDYKTSTAALLKNAPAIQDGQFKVKRMIG
jgi:aspartyl-tRNA(Asn)/glutamyl-tRNA(Gln) amidotransferase subunit C